MNQKMSEAQVGSTVYDECLCVVQMSIVEETLESKKNPDSKKNLSEEEKDMIVNEISLLIQNIIVTHH